MFTPHGIRIVEHGKMTRLLLYAGTEGDFNATWMETNKLYAPILSSRGQVGCSWFDVEVF